MSAAPPTTGLRQPLGRLARRWRTHRLLDGAVRWYTLFLCVALVQIVLDGWIRMPLEQRIVTTSLLALVLIVGIAWWLARPLLRRLPDVWLAQLVDRSHPELRDLVATAVQFEQGRVGASESNSRGLISAVLHDARARIQSVSYEAVLPWRPMRRRAIELLALLGASVVVGVVISDVTSAWFQRNWLLSDVPWPQRTSIHPEQFDAAHRRVAAIGDELIIQALNEGVVPRAVRVEWRTASGLTGTEPMTRIGDVRWEARLGTLNEDVFFRIIGGDERTSEYHVIAVERPRIIGTVATITPPAYTRLPAETLTRQATLELLAGSTLAIEATANKPLSSAALVDADGVGPQVEIAPSGKLTATWTQPIAGNYRFVLRDEHGFENLHPVRLAIKVVPDDPPEVTLRIPGVGGSVTPQAQLTVAVELRDAYGLMSGVLSVQRNEDAPYERVLTSVVPGRIRAAAELSLTLSDFGVTPGDQLALRAAAIDIAEPIPNQRQSAPARLRVVTARDLRTELAARELELRRDFQRFLSAQRGLSAALAQFLPDIAEQPSASVRQRLIGLARRQAGHARSTLQIAESYDQILSEMKINQIVREGDERRLAGRIRDPLQTLGEGAMLQMAQRIEALQSAVDAAAIARIPNDQAAIIDQMRTILASMLEWEGYREAVELLEEIIAAQGELNEQTAAALEAELDDILGLDEPIDEDDPND